MLCHMFPLVSSWLQTSTQDFDGERNTGKNKDFNEIIQHTRNHSPHSVLIGKGNIDIISLLFQGAVSCGAKDLSVVFICPHPLDKIPNAVHGMPKPEAKILQHVLFLYLKTVGELVNYCASIHTRSVLPDVIIVDNLNHYVGQESKGEHGLAKLCALLLDTVTFIQSKNERQHCQLVMGCQECHDIQQSVLQRFRLIPVHIEGSSDLSQRKLSTRIENTEVTVQYRMAEGVIFLQDVELIKR